MKGRSLVGVLAVCVFAASACRGGSSQAVRVPSSDATSSVQRVAAVATESDPGARAVNDLALDLLRLNSGVDAGNVALSPWSIATALAMTRDGARGVTADEMNRVLHVADPATFDQAMNSLDQALRSRNATFGPFTVDLTAANRLFAQAGLRLRPEFLDAMAASYGAAVGQVDYQSATEEARRTINGWVNGETRDRIPELIPTGVLDDRTRLVLANAMYLRADWSTPFAKERTADGTFHAPTGDVPVAFMNGDELWGWSEGDGWKAVDLPYVGGELSMTVVVPDAGGFDRFVSGFDRTMLDRVVATRPAHVQLRLPRFDIDRSLKLGEQLKTLGMQHAFSDDADFAGITTDAPLQLAEVMHQANVTVDEQGTVAAAATAVIARASSAIIAENKELDVDRPFVFLIRDRSTGALLFAGQVTNPA